MSRIPLKQHPHVKSRLRTKRVVIVVAAAPPKQPDPKALEEHDAFRKLVQTQHESHGDKMAYVFWTGGFDSTFAVLRLLFEGERVVQPIYLTGHVDNAEHKKWFRQNRAFERHAQHTIHEKVEAQCLKPYAESLLPTVELKYVPDNEAVTSAFQKLNVHNRKYNQYEAMARCAKFYDIPIHIGVIGIEGEGSGAPLPQDRWGRYLRRVLDHHAMVDSVENPLSHLVFSIAYTSKRRAYKHAKHQGYAHLLDETWSCWFPRQGKPCQRCPMCRDRVIRHPDKTKLHKTTLTTTASPTTSSLHQKTTKPVRPAMRRLTKATRRTRSVSVVRPTTTSSSVYQRQRHTRASRNTAMTSRSMLPLRGGRY